jgi:hypothetical protein
VVEAIAHSSPPSGDGCVRLVDEDFTPLITA